MNADRPDVSVVMPLHNAERFTREALRKIEELNFRNLEVIIIDDGSSDTTGDLVNAWSQTTRLTHHVHRNAAPQGVAAARNRAVAACKGRYIWFVDCDDDWSPNIIGDLWKSAESHDSDIAVCNAERLVTSTGLLTPIEDAPKEEAIPGPRALELLFEGKLQGHLWNKLFRRSLVSEYPFPQTRAHSDLGGVIEMLAHAKTVSFVPVASYVYMVRAGSILQSSTYRWDDLRDCAERAEITVRRLGSPEVLVKGIERFKFTHILIPLANERIRREGTYSRAQLPFVSGVTAKTLAGLIRSGELRIAVRLFLITYTPSLYRRLYSAYNRRRWGELLV
ncbi:glycosyltransferase family 2 protein [Pseudarthrobacter siccitolerans]